MAKNFNKKIYMKRKLILPALIVLCLLGIQACDKDETIVRTHEVVGNALIEAHKTARRAHDAKLISDGKYKQICASLRRASVLYSASCDALKLCIDSKENNYMELSTQIGVISADVMEWVWEKE